MKMWSKIKKGLEQFFTGALDYYKPSAGGGASGCIEVDPDVRKEYQETRFKDKNFKRSK